jgi:sugar O-acyltransferase (sialic acid O-acetyltransferase NeuD family)
MFDIKFHTKVVVVGAGGFAREVQDVIRNCNYPNFQYELLGFIDDFAPVGKDLHGAPVLGDFDWFKTSDAEDVFAVVGVGAPEVRRKLVKKAEALGVAFVSLADPSVVASPFVKMGKGVVICPGVILTNNITIGDHVHLNLSSTVGHDAVLEDYVTTAPGVHINGNNLIKEGAYFGTGANLNEKITVGEWSIIGSGASVVRDIPANVTAVGCPAKVIKTREEGWYLS